MLDEVKDDFQEDSLKGKYLTFVVGKEAYGIEIRFVTEIVNIQVITEMPEMPAYIKGVINLRSKIIPVLDVRIRFGKQEREYDDRTCIIVLNNDDLFTGLIVDSVSEVLTINDVVELVDIDNMNANGFVKNIGKLDDKVILLVNCSKLISKTDLTELAIL
jgi:purine-binding chemotaxis protein CheW